ncbi:MAG: TlpA family protein disulfide reductase, partial [Bacteroidales bacterium]|nr:TlpA family protein disulfide reductase [Bacteroidales bacterium]
MSSYAAKVIVFFIIAFAFKVSTGQQACKTINASNADTLIYQIDTAGFPAKLYVLDFFASYCKPCFNIMPHFKALIKNNPDKSNIQFFYANPYDSPGIIKKLIRKYELSVPVIHDTNQFLYHKCSYKVLPRSIILDSSLNLLWEGRPGQIDHELLSHLLQHYDFEPKQLKDSLIYQYQNGKMKIKVALCRTDSVTKLSWDDGIFNTKIELLNKSFLTCVESMFDQARLMNYQLKFQIPPPPEPYYNISLSCKKGDFLAAIDSIVTFLCEFNILKSNWKEEPVTIYKLKIVDRQKLSSLQSKNGEG